MDGSTKHPQDAFLIDVVRVLIVVGTAVGDIIYDRVERENDVWQHKKVTDPLPKRRFFLLIAHEPFTNSSSQGQWLVTRDGSSMYAIAVFQGTADPDGPGPMAPISATGLGSGLADMLIMHLSDPSINTAVEDIAPRESPILSAPYPNPFSTHTSFTLSAPKTQYVRVDLYNAIGQHIHTLFDAVAYSNSSQEIFFDKISLPSGLYFIQAKGEDFISTEKLLKVN